MTACTDSGDSIGKNERLQSVWRPPSTRCTRHDASTQSDIHPLTRHTRGGSLDRSPAASPAQHSKGRGRWPFAGRRVTGFRNKDQIESGSVDNAPWLSAEALRDLAANQNPASSAALAVAVVTALE